MTRSQLKKMINAGQWKQLSILFNFTPTFLLTESGRSFMIDWRCVPKAMVDILWNTAGIDSDKLLEKFQRKERIRAELAPRGLRLHTIQNGLCFYCNKFVEYRSKVKHNGRNVLGWTIDHRTPICRGGDNSWQNTVGCCYQCNHEKSCLTELEFRNTPAKYRKELVKTIMLQVQTAIKKS